MNEYTASAIIQTQLLPHEELEFKKLYERFIQIVTKDKQLSNLDIFKKEINSGFILKVYTKEAMIFENELLNRFLKIFKTHFLIKPKVIFHKVPFLFDFRQ